MAITRTSFRSAQSKNHAFVFCLQPLMIAQRTMIGQYSDFCLDTSKKCKIQLTLFKAPAIGVRGIRSLITMRSITKGFLKLFDFSSNDSLKIPAIHRQVHSSWRNNRKKSGMSQKSACCNRRGFDEDCPNLYPLNCKMIT